MKAIPRSSIRRLLERYKRHGAPHPWRLIWKKSNDPYPVLLSEIMLQQTTLAMVLPVFAQVLQRFPKATSLATASEKEIRTAFAGLGYYSRFFRLQKALQIISEKGWPQSVEAWRTLPGIGDYTSAIMASIINDQALPAVDGNVERIVARLRGLAEPIASPVLKKSCKDLLQPVLVQVPPGLRGDFNQALMELGQTVCTPKQPRCDACPLRQAENGEGCSAFAHGMTEQLPLPKERKAFEEVALHAHWIERKGRIFLKFRSTEERFLKNSLGFPLTDEPPRTGTLVGTFKHTITHHRLKITLWRRPPNREELSLWMSLPALSVRGELHTSLDLKALELATGALS